MWADLLLQAGEALSRRWLTAGVRRHAGGHPSRHLPAELSGFKSKVDRRSSVADRFQDASRSIAVWTDLTVLEDGASGTAAAGVLASLGRRCRCVIGRDWHGACGLLLIHHVDSETCSALLPERVQGDFMRMRCGKPYALPGTLQGMSPRDAASPPEERTSPPLRRHLPHADPLCGNVTVNAVPAD